MGEKTAPQAKKWALPVIIVLLVCVIGLLVMLLMRKPAAPAGTDGGSTDSGLKIGYAEGAVALDPEGLQAAIDEMYEKTAEGRIALEYKNDALSSDGQTFACYINNAPSNTYDEFIGIYADAEYTDQLFLSELIRPGTGFDSITLDRALDAGSHLVYVVYTQVSEEDGEQVMRGQTAVTMNFVVRD